MWKRKGDSDSISEPKCSLWKFSWVKSFKNPSELGQKLGWVYSPESLTDLGSWVRAEILKPGGGQWGWHRCSPLSPASSPAWRSGGSAEGPSARPGSLAGWGRSSGGSWSSRQGWHSASHGTLPPRSQRGIAQGPHCGYRGRQSQEESEFLINREGNQTAIIEGRQSHRVTNYRHCKFSKNC